MSCGGGGGGDRSGGRTQTAGPVRCELAQSPVQRHSVRRHAVVGERRRRRLMGKRATDGRKRGGGGGLCTTWAVGSAAARLVAATAARRCRPRRSEHEALGLASQRQWRRHTASWGAVERRVSHRRLMANHHQLVWRGRRCCRTHGRWTAARVGSPGVATAVMAVAAEVVKEARRAPRESSTREGIDLIARNLHCANWL